MALTKIQSSNIADGAVSTPGMEEDIALLGFKVASNGSLSKYNLVDQTEDAFATEDGIDGSASTNEVRNEAGEFYSGVVAAPIGGTETTYTSGGTDYVVRSFLSGTTNLVFDTSGTIDYLLVAGGGSGGQGAIPGGGGAGGLLTATGYSVSKGTYPIVVGAGGTGGSGIYNNGEDTTAFSLTAVGGGYGGSGPSTANASNGGSGGGNHGYTTSGAGTGTAGQGNNGGVKSGGGYGAGGGGGAGAVGGNATSPNGGAGGVGLSNSLRTGSGVFYAGGGGGSAWTGTNGSGGNGGGGAGDGTAGTANTGGGGGASGGGGGNGGSGIVVVRWVSGAMGPSYNNMTLVSNSTTAQSTPTKGDIVMTYTNGAGTATINTDLKAYCSRDDGTTYTQMTLVAQGNTGSSSPHFIVAAHDVDISSQPSGTAMRYKIETLNQSVSKQTRIHAVSLGWS